MKCSQEGPGEPTVEAKLPPRCSPERPRGSENGERMLQYGPSVALELRRSAFRLDETHIFMKNERGASVICTSGSQAPLQAHAYYRGATHFGRPKSPENHQNSNHVSGPLPFPSFSTFLGGFPVPEVHITSVIRTFSF